jgi:hypothetical protein
LVSLSQVLKLLDAMMLAASIESCVCENERNGIRMGIRGPITKR